MDEDDLEYHITFPSPGLETTDDSEEDKETVVLILGWAGSIDKHLAKYSLLYEQKGCITIRCSISMEQILFKTNGARKVAEKLLELLSDLSLDLNPVMIHLFSNGGGGVYRQISQLVHQSNPPLLDIRGCVLDSAPSKVSIFTAVRASFRAIQVKLTWLRYPIAAFVFLVMSTVYLYNFIATLLGLSTTQRHSYYRAMKEDKARCPQLYLFSKADDLVPHKDVQEMVDYRKSKGIDVESICWDDSPHVQHLRVHREAYIAAVYNFLNKCLA